MATNHDPLLRDLYNRLPSGYYERGIRNNILQRIWHQRRFRIISEMVEPASRVLDIGCNDGTFTGVIAKKIPAAEIFGIDISQPALEHAQKKYPIFHLQEASAYDLPFPNQAFDAIFCLEVLEHFSNPQRAINEAARCLKETGYLVLLVPNETILFKIIWFLWTRATGRVWKDAHLQQFSLDDLGKILETANLTIVESRYTHLNMLLALKARPTGVQKL